MDKTAPFPSDLPRYVRTPRKGALGISQSVWRWIIIMIVLVLMASAARLAEVDLGRLAENAPRIGMWVGRIFPPYDGFRNPPTTEEFNDYLLNALTTVAIATIGTGTAAVLALIPAVFATRTLTKSNLIFYPTRWFLNTLRGIDSFIFAIFFVAAVGLGPFAGVLGVAFHTWGSLAKLYAENLENTELAPMMALESSGVSRPRAIIYALLPDAMPSFISTSLYIWEVNVRLSVALGVVGAGGIGQDVKNAIDLLNFPHLGALLLIILVMVTIIDQISTRLRAMIR
ncbi:MAG: phosphonate ABC transporter, permease protein PhnE [Chloroflexi bacterium]|nr:phosphonate ABC transporter, permease protein PhnE [Chloroflexota bacterium]